MGTLVQFLFCYSFLNSEGTLVQLDTDKESGHILVQNKLINPCGAVGVSGGVHGTTATGTTHGPKTHHAVSKRTVQCAVL
jgi:hypothetical protein